MQEKFMAQLDFSKPAENSKGHPSRGTSSGKVKKKKAK